MGLIGFTMFCRNGHVVKNVLDNEVDNTESVTKCPYCNSTEFAIQYAWGDDAYKAVFPEYEGWTVPMDPTKYEWIKVNTDTIRGEVKVPMFDVSSISEDEWFTMCDNRSEAKCSCL